MRSIAVSAEFSASVPDAAEQTVRLLGELLPAATRFGNDATRDSATKHRIVTTEDANGAGLPVVGLQD